MHKWMIGAAAMACAMTATPALAQQSSYKMGPLWTAARISVDDGQMENYMDYVTSTWMANQEFAKSQGWLLEYHALESVNPRDGEPNIVLLTRYNDFPPAAETERRDAILQKRMNQDDHSAAAASGQRLRMRKLMGSVMYRELQKR